VLAAPAWSSLARGAGRVAGLATTVGFAVAAALS